MPFGPICCGLRPRRPVTAPDKPASGSSEVAGLVINGTAIAVSGNPNQTVDLPGLRVVINEQSGSANGNRSDITVNALHVRAFDPLSGQTLADVVISSAPAHIRGAGWPTPVAMRRT